MKRDAITVDDDDDSGKESSMSDDSLFLIPVVILIIPAIMIGKMLAGKGKDGKKISQPTKQSIIPPGNNYPPGTDHQAPGQDGVVTFHFGSDPPAMGDGPVTNMTEMVDYSNRVLPRKPISSWRNDYYEVYTANGGDVKKDEDGEDEYYEVSPVE